MLTDIAVNLTDGMFAGWYNGKQSHEPDLDFVLDRARMTGCRRIIITGGNVAESCDAIALARRINGMEKAKSPRISAFSTVGCHPTRCGEFDSCGDTGTPSHPDSASLYLNSLRKLIADNLWEGDGTPSEESGVVVAIGECGLDYDRTRFCDVATQKKYFALQFALAQEFSLPMFLHNRAASVDFCEIVAAHRDSFSQAVVHSFDGTSEELGSMLQQGLFVGVNGCSLKTASNVSVAASVPIDRLMIETDAPWCDIRPTHASSDVLSKARGAALAPPFCELGKNLQSFPVVKKEKFVQGMMVKGRAEPCQLLNILLVVYFAQTNCSLTLKEFSRMIEENVDRLFFYRRK